MAVTIARNWRQLSIRSLLVATATLLAALGAYTLINHNTQPAHASSGVGFTEFATHPYASQAGYDNTSTNYYTGQQLCPPPASFCPVGQTLIDMNVTDDGQLVAGYGDWNSNVDSFGVAAGRVGVMPLDLNTGTWGDMFLAGSEALDVVRKINGHLYIPTTDPSDKAATGNSTGNIPGYITNDTGEWRFVENGPRNSIHVFDVATRDGTDLWTAGSSSDVAGGVAVARQSTDGGETWSNALLGSGGLMERFYTLSAIDNKIYTKAPYVGTSQAFDGTSWSNAPTYPCGNTRKPRLVETFQDYVICVIDSDSKLQYFDGSTSQVGGSLPWMLKDLFVTNDEVYGLSGQSIYVTSSLSDWQLLDVTAPTGAASLAVYDDRLYVGDDKGVIHRSDSLVSEIDEGTFSLEECLTFDASTGYITDYLDAVDCPKDLVIPDYIDGVAVTGIGDYAFSGKGLNSVVIPDSVTSIGYYAFPSNNLTSVTIGNSVESIGYRAFSNNNLTSVTIGQSVESIGEGAFHGAFSSDNPASVVIPDSVITIGDSAFFENNLASVTIGNSVESIGYRAFRDNNLTSLTIPDSVTSIGGNAFSNNSLTSVIIGASVEDIGSSAFSRNQLDSLTIPDSVTSIGNSAFSNNSLTSVAISKSIDSIGYRVFMDNNLVSVTIPDNVTSIDDVAFLGNQLTSVTIPSSVTSVGDSAFAENRLTSFILEGTPSLGESALAGQYDAAAADAADQACYDEHGDDWEAVDACYGSWIQDNSSVVQLFAPADNPYSNTLYDFWIDGYYEGGYVVNPASVTTSYLDQDGNQIQPSTQVFGEGVTDHLLSSLMAIKPDLVADDLADFYYTSGHTYTATPQDIDGYTAPDPQTITLAAGNNDITFTYTAQGQSGGEGTEGDTGSDVGAPNTGLQKVSLTAAIALMAILVATSIIWLVRRKLTRQ